MSVIVTHDLCKRFGDHEVLRRVNLRVPAGSRFGFLGPNGAGKTTTIRILLGLLRASAGSARMLDQDTWRCGPRIRAQVGYLPGDVRFYDGLTGRATLAFFDAARGSTSQDEIRRLTRRFDLDLDKRVREYSRGMRQKLGLIQALMHRPQLLILDEPTISLDPLIREVLYDELRVAVAKHIKRWGYAQKLVAQKLGSNENYVCNYLSGRFDQIPRATLQKLARELNEWAELDHRRSLRRGEQVFVRTKVAERIIKVARHAIEANDIVVVHAPAGCGKTVTLQELQKLIPASIYIYVTPDASQKSGFLRELNDQVWGHRGPSRPRLADVIERLKFSDRLLMIDNADVLEPSTFPVIMALHDTCNIPILIAGTYKLL